ncbi:hypothetical protein BDY21DRAFT_334926 [Lineolata rhizophorae]|uniref:F-box domain-containing protein n=1 Tax=Lineolata rhizophorae TaxID=578093 RepID=A0A6A6P8U1_9PEZI|nr:hypothetical protein BDY21DRAFT_334926 [Lineolata rhizophorae]
MARREVHQPPEIVLLYFEYIQQDVDLGQKTLASCCRVSRTFCHYATKLLYKRPQLTHKNFDKFISTVAPSVTTRRAAKNDVAKYVEDLDLHEIFTPNYKAAVSRLLRRSHGKLKSFTSPVQSLAINSLAPLTKCTGLCILRLEHTQGTFTTRKEELSLQNIRHVLKAMPLLKEFSFPKYPQRNFPDDIDDELVIWPPHLEELSISGNMASAFWGMLCTDAGRLPKSVTKLHLSKISQLNPETFRELMTSLGGQLRELSVTHITSLIPYDNEDCPCDGLLDLLPNLTNLTLLDRLISFDFLTIYDDGDTLDSDANEEGENSDDGNSRSSDLSRCSNLARNYVAVADNPRVKQYPLEEFSLWSVDPAKAFQRLRPSYEDGFETIDLVYAIAEGRLPRLRRVEVLWENHSIWGGARREKLQSIKNMLVEQNKRNGVLADPESVLTMVRDSNTLW